MQPDHNFTEARVRSTAAIPHVGLGCINRWASVLKEAAFLLIFCTHDHIWTTLFRPGCHILRVCSDTSTRDQSIEKAGYAQELGNEQLGNSAWTKEKSWLEFKCFYWSSKKGTDLFVMLHKEKLVLMDEIYRKISTQRKEAAWADRL